MCVRPCVCVCVCVCEDVDVSTVLYSCCSGTGVGL